MTMRRLPFAFLATAFLPAPPAHAGGGAHVVDDAEVDAPGTCHVEAWASFGRDTRSATLAPACALHRLPGVELGKFIEYAHDRERHSVLVGPSAKMVLRPAERGLGLAVVAEAAFDLQHGGLDSVSLILPITWDATERLRLNANVGAIWPGDGPSRATFAGMQVEYAASDTLSLMTETYRVTDVPTQQFQAGIRWHARPSLALDLLVNRHAATAGLTFTP